MMIYAIVDVTLTVIVGICVFYVYKELKQTILNISAENEYLQEELEQSIDINKFEEVVGELEEENSLLNKEIKALRVILQSHGEVIEMNAKLKEELSNIKGKLNEKNN
jgi:predicted RNase H-like nuclease (RuvC/YqgF family)